MDRKKYVIYKCSAKREDGTIIERIFKFPSFWCYELIIAALHTTCDAPGIIDNIEILLEGKSDIYTKDEKQFMSNLTFDEIEEKFDVILYYDDGLKTSFECEKIGIDYAKNNITRKTPILVSIQGYNRLTKKDYDVKNENRVLLDSYNKGELLHIQWAKNDITRLFTLYVEEHFYE